MRQTTKILTFFAVATVCSQVQATPVYSITDLGSMGQDSFGFGINASGMVSGRFNDHFLGGNVHAFVTDIGGQMHDLGTLGGNDSSGLGINSKGQVTG